LALNKADLYFNCLSSGLKIDLTNIDADLNDEANRKKIEEIRSTGYLKNEDIEFLTKDVFSFSSLYDFQRDAIKKILINKESLIVSMPTGCGKSLVYQFSALMQEGLTLVITPFISLMLDQLGKLPRLLPGACLNSMLTVEKKLKILELAKKNQIKILYMTPEMFETDVLEVILSESFPKVSMICIDEIHCISEFSHSYRIAFLKIGRSIKLNFKNSIVIGLTATANKRVLNDLCSSLNIKYIIGESLRPAKKQKIRAMLINEQAKFAELKKILENYPFCSFRSILIFVSFKYTAQRLYYQLTNNGISSCYYYNPDLEESKRMDIHQSFMNNKIRVLIATASFSMGLDKSDIQGVNFMK
jgi:RecQ family ATP-dependent DNA helicase